MTVATSPVTAADYLRSAIDCWESEIRRLTTLGLREGSIVTSRTGGIYVQHHWFHDSKRLYVSKKNLAQYQEQIDRGREVDELHRKINQAQNLIRE
jgi:hypothetical protein